MKHVFMMIVISEEAWMLIYYIHSMRMSHQEKNDYCAMDDCSAPTPSQASVVDSDRALTLPPTALPLGASDVVTVSWWHLSSLWQCYHRFYCRDHRGEIHTYHLAAICKGRPATYCLYPAAAGSFIAIAAVVNADLGVND